MRAAVAAGYQCPMQSCNLVYCYPAEKVNQQLVNCRVWSQLELFILDVSRTIIIIDVLIEVFLPSTVTPVIVLHPCCALQSEQTNKQQIFLHGSSKISYYLANLFHRYFEFPSINLDIFVPYIHNWLF